MGRVMAHIGRIVAMFFLRHCDTMGMYVSTDCVPANNPVSFLYLWRRTSSGEKSASKGKNERGYPDIKG
jgi:hypothetical protein